MENYIDSFNTYLKDEFFIEDALYFLAGSDIHDESGGIMCPYHEDSDYSGSVYYANDHRVFFECSVCGTKKNAFEIIADAKKINIFDVLDIFMFHRDRNSGASICKK